MRKIIIATSGPRLTDSLIRIVSENTNQTPKSVKSSAELFACTREYPDAILILGTLKDKPQILVARNAPENWDVIILLSSDSPMPYYSSNIIPLNLPVNKREFLETVYSVIDTNSQSFGSKTTAKMQRKDEDKRLIEQAKKRIMKEREFSESDAHKFLQRYSMNLGITMVECAKRFLK